MSRSNLMEALEALKHGQSAYLSRQFFFRPEPRRTMTKSRTCAGTSGLVTTEVNFLGIELPSAMCTSYLTENYVRIVFRRVYLIETVDLCVCVYCDYMSSYSSRRFAHMLQKEKQHRLPSACPCLLPNSNNVHFLRKHCFSWWEFYELSRNRQAKPKVE